MSDLKILEKEKIEKVSGGKYHDYFNYKTGDRKKGPCKYCGALDSLVFNGVLKTGWETGNDFPMLCNVFTCEKCGEESYFSVDDDHLLM